MDHQPSLPVSEAAITQVFRRIGSSPLFLAVCVCQTLTLLIDTATQLGNGQSLSVELVSLLPAVGFWLICYTCRREQSPLRTDGLTLLQIVYTITAILVTVALGLCVIALCISTTAPTHLYRSGWQALENSLPVGTMPQIYEAFQSLTQGTSYENFVRTVVTTALVVCVVVLTAAAFFQILILRTIKRLKQHATGVTTSRSIPLLLIILCYASAVACLSGLVITILWGGLSLSTVGWVLNAGCSLVTAGLLQTYRKQAAPHLARD